MARRHVTAVVVGVVVVDAIVVTSLRVDAGVDIVAVAGVILVVLSLSFFCRASGACASVYIRLSGTPTAYSFLPARWSTGTFARRRSERTWRRRRYGVTSTAPRRTT